MDTVKSMLKNQIRDIRKTDCCKTIELCNNYLELFHDKNEDIWFSNHNLSRMYKEIGNIDLSIKYSLKALQVIDEDCPDYILTSWLLACCLDLNGDKEGAKKIYYKCSKLYKIVGEDYYRMCIIFNIAKINKDISKMLKVIHIAEINNLNKVFDDFNDLDNIVYKMGVEFIDFCICGSLDNAITELFITIKNKTIRDNVKKYYFKKPKAGAI